VLGSQLAHEPRSPFAAIIGAHRGRIDHRDVCGYTIVERALGVAATPSSTKRRRLSLV
jgi:hypothetical protein